MTINEAITRVDNLKYNTFTRAEKIAWLNKIEWMLKLNIIDTHMGGEDIEFNGYTQTSHPDTVLIAPPPFDELYLRWLEAQIDLHNGENELYNTSIVMFNSEYEQYENWYNRTYLPKKLGRFLF